MKKIAIIPARGGSKRVPRKNIKHFLGKPIIAYAIGAALESLLFDVVMVSTDDEEIAEIAQKYGASVPFFRSAALANDTAMTVPVLIEVLEMYLQENEYFEYGCCIYPCAPFVSAARLKEGMELLISSSADTVLPLVKFSYPPQRGLIIQNGVANMLSPENYNVRSQDLTPIYHDAGQFYCFSTVALKEQETLLCRQTVPLVLSELEVQDIDTIEDWSIAEMKYSYLNRS